MNKKNKIIEPFNIEINLENNEQTRGSGSFTLASKGAIAITCNWSSSANSGNNTSTVNATLTVYASASGNCLGGSHLTIGSSRKDYNTRLNQSGSAATLTLTSHSATIGHNADGTGSVTISGALVWNGYMWHPSGGQNFNTLSGSGTVTLDTIVTTPNVPPSATISGIYAKNNHTTISFGGSTGAVTGYKIYYREWNKITDSYSSWIHHGNNTSGSYSIGHGHVNGDAFQMGVSAVNGAYESAIRETGWIYHQGLSVNNGGYRNGTIRVWNGNSWVQGYVRVWNGSSWVIGQ